VIAPNANPTEILRERARLLARPPDDGADRAGSIEILEFRLAQERYAVEHRYVQEVCPFRNLTPLPCTPPFVRGIVNIRGRILPVFDLKRLFGLPEVGVTDLHNIILVRDRELEVGLLADSIVGATALPLYLLQPSLPTLTRIRESYLKGITYESLVVLDVAGILADPRILVNEEVPA
jgi:purine-binding chemotaxis protein CheW